MHVPKVPLFCCLWVILLMAGTAPARACPDGILRVKPGNPATENGCTWETAYNTLQEALAVANPGDKVWVAKGTYTPGLVPADKFQLESGVKIYGGLAGNEVPATFDPEVNPRDFVANETNLSGNLGGTSHSNTIVLANGVDNTALLDGFTVTGAAVHAIHCSDSSPTLRNLLVRENHSSGDGAALLVEGYSNPLVQFSTFAYNTAEGSGGAVSADSYSEPRFEDCLFFANGSNSSGGAILSEGNLTIRQSTFTANRAWYNDGGGICAKALDLRDCTFDANFAGSRGGAVYCSEGADVLVVKSRFVNNAAITSNGGGLALDRVKARVVNCEFVGNAATNYGGGLHIWESATETDTYDAELTNCLIARNRAHMGGGTCANTFRAATVRERVLADAA